MAERKFTNEEVVQNVFYDFVDTRLSDFFKKGRKASSRKVWYIIIMMPKI